MNIIAVYKILYTLLALLGGFDNSVFFESLESKTSEGEAVYNKISLSQNDHQDIWIMKQSHRGINAHKWDKIKIIVDKTKTPYEASFQQLKNNKPIEFKTSCFRCHANGPRLIRPNYQSKEVKLNSKDKLTILKWNILIKSYGEIRYTETNHKRKVKFLDKKVKLKKLNIASCAKCHYRGGPRAELTSHHAKTIEFLVKNHSMPPWPYEIENKDKNTLKEFIYGF